MNFYIVATVAAVVSVLIGTIWIFAGQLMLKRWGVKSAPVGLMLGRRLGAVQLGVALLLFLVRGSSSVETHTAVSAGFCLALTLLAVFGLIELISRRAGRGILFSVVMEALLAAGFAYVLFSQY